MYFVEADEGLRRLVRPSPSLSIANGGISADVVLSDGEGRVGLMAREIEISDEASDYVRCWIASDGSAGCDEIMNDKFTNLFTTETDLVNPADVNHLFVIIVDDQVVLDVNDETVGEAPVSSARAGSWGIYVGSDSGTTTGWFDNIRIYSSD
jgi:hypothetical protein